MIITILFYKPKGFFYLLSLYYKISIYIVRRNLINKVQFKVKKGNGGYYSAGNIRAR